MEEERIINLKKLFEKVLKLEKEVEQLKKELGVLRDGSKWKEY